MIPFIHLVFAFALHLQSEHLTMTDTWNPTVTRVYYLYCPMCDAKLYSMWFAFSGDEDDHGYLCCSTCVTNLVTMSGIRRSQWHKVILKEYRRYPECSWAMSLFRTNTLLRDADAAAASSTDDEQSDADTGTDVRFTNAAWNEYAPLLCNYVHQSVLSESAKCGVDVSTATAIWDEMHMTVDALPSHKPNS